MVKSTIEKLLLDGNNIIKKRDFNNPSLDVQLILSHLLQKDKVYLFLHREEEVDEAVEEKFYEMVKRRNAGYPLQYMINSQEFMGLDFYVQEGVLVPRPDTEILVEKIIKIVNETDLKSKKIKILDVGTGSGAIALSLAYYLKNAKVTAIDISEEALKTAEINKKRLNLSNIIIVNADIFKNESVFDEKYDIVVSNPPYIERSSIKDLPVEVSRFEPKLALDGGDDGLEYYRQIVKVFKNLNLNEGILCVEIGSNQGETVTKIFENADIFEKIECDKDYSCNDRVVTGFL